MRRMVDEPEHRAEINDSLRELFAAMFVTTTRSGEGRAEPARAPVGGLRLPLVEADDAETAPIRAALEHLGLLDNVPHSTRPPSVPVGGTLPC